MKHAILLYLSGSLGLAVAAPYLTNDASFLARTQAIDPLMGDVLLGPGQLIPRAGLPHEIATLQPNLHLNARHENTSTQLLKRDFEAPKGTKWQNLPNGNIWGRGQQSDHAMKSRVINTWETSLRMIGASLRLKGVADFVDGRRLQEDPCTSNNKEMAEVALKYRKWLAATEPAYTQLFAADVLTIRSYADALKTLNDAVQNPKQTLYLTMTNTYHDLRGNDLCTKGRNTEAAQAYVVQAGGLRELVDFRKSTPNAADLPPEDGWILNFCDRFFDMPQSSALFEDYKNHRKSKEQVCVVQAHDTTERVLIHELTHLPWTLDTNNPEKVKGDAAKDIVGLKEVSSYSYSGGKAKKDLQKPRSDFTYVNADSYAWFIIYDFLNHAQECAGTEWKDDALFQAQCTDTWQKGKEKYVKSDWPSFCESVA